MHFRSDEPLAGRHFALVTMTTKPPAAEATLSHSTSAAETPAVPLVCRVSAA
jgi:hypothetical protein